MNKWLDDIEKAQDGNTINNGWQIAADVVQHAIPGLRNYPINLGSIAGLTESDLRHRPEAWSDRIGLIPNPYAQAASTVAMIMEKERENLHTYQDKKNRGKKLEPKSKPTNKKVAESTAVKQNGGQFDGLTNKGFNYNGAWGGPAQDGDVLTDYDPVKNPALKGVGERVLSAQLENYKKSGNQRGIEKNQALLDRYAAFNTSKQKYIDDRKNLVGDYTTRQNTLKSLSDKAKEKYGFDVSQEDYAKLSPREMISQKMVERANAVTASGKGYPLTTDLGAEGNKLTCIHGVCKAASEAGVNFDVLQGQTGVRRDETIPNSKYTVDYNPTWVENDNYKKVGYERVPEGEAPQRGDLAQYETVRDKSHSDVEHMEFVKNVTPTGYESFNNYNQTNYPTPGTGNAIRTFEPGSTKIKEFPDTFYFRLKDEVANKIVNTDPQYKPIVESYAKYKDSEEAKQIHDNRDYLDVNKSGYEQAQKFLESLDKPKSKKQDGGLIPIAQDGLIQSSNARMKRGVELSLKERANLLADEHKLRTTGQVPNPRSVKFKQQAPQREEVRKSVPQSTKDKIKEVSLNPLTAFGYAARNENLPDNFSRGERNPLDNAVDLINPAFYANEGKQAVTSLATGHPIDAAGHALNFIPMVEEAGAAAKALKADPLLSSIPEVVRQKAYKDFAQSAAFSAMNKIHEKTVNLPGLKNIYKEMAYRVADLNPYTMRTVDELKGAVLGALKGTKYEPNYRGLIQYQNDKSEQDLIRKYIFNDNKGLEPSDIPIKGLDRYVDKYGDLENFKLNTEHLSNSERQANTLNLKNLDDNFTYPFIPELKTDWSSDVPLKERFGNHIKDWIKENNGTLYGSNRNTIGNDNIAGHIKSFRHDPATDKYYAGMQDIWKFDPGDYMKKWNMEGYTPSKFNSNNISLDNHLRALDQQNQIKIMERSGKPFVLTDEREIDFDKFEDGGVIEDNRGQWAHPGEVTRINSNNITMKGVSYPVLGISDTGDKKLMKPGKDYQFKGKSVTEYPQGKHGKELDQLTNFTNYNKPQPGGWLDNL